MFNVLLSFAVWLKTASSMSITFFYLYFDFREKKQTSICPDVNYFFIGGTNEATAFPPPVLSLTS